MGGGLGFFGRFRDADAAVVDDGLGRLRDVFVLDDFLDVEVEECRTLLLALGAGSTSMSMPMKASAFAILLSIFLRR